MQQDQRHKGSTGVKPGLTSAGFAEVARTKRKTCTQKDDEGDDENNELTSDAKRNLNGISNDGKLFPIPTTKSPLDFPLNPRYWDAVKWFKYGTVISFLILVLMGVPRVMWVWIFLFWRLMYNGGLGYILHRQSKTRFLSYYFKQVPEHPVNEMMKQYLRTQMGDDYNYDEMPAEFNAWVFFRGLVEIVLFADLVAYFFMCWSFLDIPTEITLTDIALYLIGTVLSAFALWAKADAYRVVSDFAWYWGDFFFLVDQQLTFNRVFGLFPHPMYTLGYAFYYGFSLITQSYVVFYVSLFAHALQLAFLAFVETPHIEATYGVMVADPEIPKGSYQSYFRKDLIVFQNFSIVRSSDVFMLVIIMYSVVLHLMNLSPWFYVGHAIVWRLWHSGINGVLLHKQSKEKWWTKLFEKSGSNSQQAFEEWKRLFNMSLTMTYVTFLSTSIKLLYFPESALFSAPELYKFLIRITIGLVLIALNVWTSVSTFEILGEFGWFYGDFFSDEQEFPKKVYYTGIYRFLNNPENVTGFAGFYGIALITNSWVIAGLAFFGQACQFFVSEYVEKPHMKNLYGNSVRANSGFREAINDIIKHETVTFEKGRARAEVFVKKILPEKLIGSKHKQA